jgi:hypothetical protein
MYKTISDKSGRDTDYPERQHRLDMLGRVLDGSLYDKLLYSFSQERQEGTGEYIPIFERRPSARYRLCATVVEDSVSLLFSDGRFPTITCDDEPTRNALALLIADARLPAVMIEAAMFGSVGSVCLRLRIMKGRVFVQALPTQFLTPTYDPQEPDRLIKVVERYKVRGATLRADGYTIADDDLGADFWFERHWDNQAETWMMPIKVCDARDGKKAAVDKSQTVVHSLGFCPMVWVKNLPGGDAIDGASTMVREALDTGIEIDYLLSQNSRGLRYASDPTLLIKEPAQADGAMIRSASQALIVGVDGDAKMLEISGTASEAVINYVRGLRELALEGLHGNRANADKLSAAQSGRAMELMNQSLIWLSDKLRTSYGESGILPLLRMIVTASAKMELMAQGQVIEAMTAAKPIGLRWPKWFPPTYADSLTQAQSGTTLIGGGLLSRETVVANLAPDYDIQDPAAELARIKGDQAEAQAAAIDMTTAQAAAKGPNPGKPPLSASDD